MFEHALAAYMQRVQTDHCHMQDLAFKLRRALDAASAAQWKPPATSAVTRALETLQKEFAAHTLREEEGGCLEEALAHAPKYHGAVRQIMAEHPTLLARLDQTLQLVRNAAERPQLWPTVETKIRDMVKAMLVHEVSENRIFQDAFGVDLDINCKLE